METTMYVLYSRVYIGFANVCKQAEQRHPITLTFGLKMLGVMRASQIKMVLTTHA